MCAVVSAGDSKKYLGKEYTIKDTESLSPQNQEKLFQRYQVKFGREVATTVGQSILSLYARAIGLTLPSNFLVSESVSTPKKTGGRLEQRPHY